MIHSLILLVVAILVKAMANSVVRRRARRNHITALVLLLREPRTFAGWQVRQAAARALGAELAVSTKPGPNTVVALAAEKVQRNLPPGAGTTYLINTGKRTFLLNAFSRPYMERPEHFAERIPDLRLRNAVSDHRAWISADFFGRPRSRAERGEIYAALGRLLAPFAGDDCLALYCPELERCNEYAPGIAEAMTSNNPLGIFSEPTYTPILSLDGDDPRVQGAVEEARRRWPEFVSAFEARGRSNRPFIVKARFAEGDAVEFMWVSVRQIAGDLIVGKLENSPASISKVKEGDCVTVPLSDLDDWLCEINKSPVGGFTLKPILELQQRKT